MEKVFVNINNARGRTEYQEQLIKIAAAGHDPFSLEHIEKYSSKPIIEIREHWFIIESSHPYPGSKNHLLIVANNYIETIHEVTEEANNELLQIEKDLCLKYKVEGGGIFFRHGNTDFTGATVTRLHVHFIVPDPDGPTIRIPLG